MNSKEHIFDDNFYEVLSYIINDLYVLAKELDWAFLEDNLSLINEVDWKFPKLSQYFTKDEIKEFPLVLIRIFENLLKELSKKSLEISKLEDNQKEKIVLFIKNQIKEKEIKSGYAFPNKILEIVLIEIWLDHIDEIWDVKLETWAFFDKIMTK